MARPKRQKNNNLIYILAGFVGVLLVIVIVGKSQGWVGKSKEIEVNLSKAKKATIVEKVSASGTVQPEIEIKLSPDVSGEIIVLNVEEGDSVAYGDLLVKIRPDNLESALERTKAALNQQKANLANAKAAYSSSMANFDRAKLEYDRQKMLWGQKVISKADWELAQANFVAAENDKKSAYENVRASEFIVESSQASVSEAAENLRLTNVYAPAGGTVSKLSVEKGERVVGSNMMSGTEMLRIADLNKMEVRVDVNENDIIRVVMGDTAIIDVDAYSSMDKKFRGIVTSIANTANEKVSSDAVTEFEVKIRILNSSFRDLIEERNITTPFRPGMTASVDIITERKEDILSVPLASVTTRDPNKVDRFGKDDNKWGGDEDEGSGNERPEKEGGEIKEVVFVNNEGLAKMVEVKTGISDFDNIEILEGIEEGEEVVSGPFLVVSKRVKDGDRIKPGEKDKYRGNRDED